MSRIRNEVSHNILIMSGISTELSHVYLCQELELKYLMFIKAVKGTSCLSLTGIGAKVPGIPGVSKSANRTEVSRIYLCLDFVLKYLMCIFVRNYN